MPSSMTGFGRGRGDSPSGREVTVEIRSVNHRYLDVRVVAPSELGGFVPDVERRLRGRFGRGRLDVQVSLSPAEVTPVQPRLRSDVARAWLDAYRQLAAELGVELDVSLRMLVEAPGVAGASAPESPPEVEMEEALMGALGRAADHLERMRGTEGRSLADAVLAHLDTAQGWTEAVGARIPEVVRARKQKLEVRLSELLGDTALDPSRLAQEVALLADRMDVSEELERLGAHLEHARELLASPDPVGRKLDFLVQEMNRETNTIASKVTDGGVAHIVVELKTELERTREQVQNLE